MRAWAQVRAVLARMVEGGEGGRGVGSWQRRLPRSKVGGMGFVTVVELGEGELVKGVDVEVGHSYELSGCEVVVGVESMSLVEGACGSSIIGSLAMMVRVFV